MCQLSGAHTEEKDGVIGERGKVPGGVADGQFLSSRNRSINSTWEKKGKIKKVTGAETERESV